MHDDAHLLLCNWGGGSKRIRYQDLTQPGIYEILPFLFKLESIEFNLNFMILKILRVELEGEVHVAVKRVFIEF